MPVVGAVGGDGASTELVVEHAHGHEHAPCLVGVDEDWDLAADHTARHLERFIAPRRARPLATLEGGPCGLVLRGIRQVLAHDPGHPHPRGADVARPALRVVGLGHLHDADASDEPLLFGGAGGLVGHAVAPVIGAAARDHLDRGDAHRQRALDDLRLAVNAVADAHAGVRLGDHVIQPARDSGVGVDLDHAGHEPLVRGVDDFVAGGYLDIVGGPDRLDDAVLHQHHAMVERPLGDGHDLPGPDGVPRGIRRAQARERDQ